MRYLLMFCLTAGLLCPDVTTAGMLPGGDSLQTVVDNRRAVLAERYGIIWPDSTPLLVEIGFPPNTPSGIATLRAANFTYDPPTLWINPLALPLDERMPPPRLALQEVARQSFGDFNPKLDHELGHYFYALVLRRVTGLRMPLIKHGRYTANTIAHQIMTEGMATAIERNDASIDTSDISFRESVDLRTEEILTMPDVHEEICYEAGSRLIGPLVNRFGLHATTEYIIRHPLVLPDNNLRQHVTAWRRAAWQALGRKP